MRKTAAVCVAKLFDINPEMVEDRGFLDMLRVSQPSGSCTRWQQGSVPLTHPLAERCLTKPTMCPGG